MLLNFLSMHAQLALHPSPACAPSHTCRLDNCAGSGLHVTPTGSEFDEKFLRLGSSLSIRAAGGLSFPRSLPIDRESDEWGFMVHRLGIKTLW